MKSLRLAVGFFILILALFVFPVTSLAWDCPSGQIRQQAPSGTPGAVVVQGIPFVCVPTPSNDPATKNTLKSISSSNSSVSDSGNSSSTATGGSVTNSGNSSNKNTNIAQGGAGGSASQNQSQSNSSSNDNQSSASNNGNNSNNSSTVYNQVHQTPRAYAPDAIPSAPCVKGFSGGASTPLLGGTFGAGKVDKGCEARETARAFALLNNPTAAAKILCSTDAAKRAHLTMSDCLAMQAPVAAAVPVPEDPRPTVVVVPVQKIDPAPPVAKVEAPVDPRLIGICTFAGKTSCTNPGSDATLVNSARPTSICKIMLDAARKALRDNPNSIIVLRANKNSSEPSMVATSRGYNVKRQLEADGVASSRIRVETGDSGGDRTVEISLVPQS